MCSSEVPARESGSQFEVPLLASCRSLRSVCRATRILRVDAIVGTSHAAHRSHHHPYQTLQKIEKQPSAAHSPGGVSTTNQSNSPQTTSPKNCLTIASFFGPRQTTDSREERRRKPIEMQASRPGEERVREPAVEEGEGWEVEEGCRSGRTRRLSATESDVGNGASEAHLVGLCG